MQGKRGGTPVTSENGAGAQRNRPRRPSSSISNGAASRQPEWQTLLDQGPCRNTRGMTGEGREQHEYRGRERVCEALTALSAFRGLGALGQTLDDRPCTDSVAFEPTLVDHQGVGNGVRKARDWCFVIRLHRADLDDFAVRLDKRDREWNRGIFHPERNALRRRKDKKHAGVFSKRLPEP